MTEILRIFLSSRWPKYGQPGNPKFVFFFYFHKKIVWLILKNIKIAKMNKKVPSRPIHTHPAAGPEITFFKRLALITW